jgi:long-subunit fatty acid transport protein
MKKIILSAVAVIAFGITNAQSTKFGLKAGLNVANQVYSGTGAPIPSSIIGFNLGGFLDVKITDKFHIQPELLYSTQGSKFNMPVPSGGIYYNTENTFMLAYLNIPVMFKYYAAEKFSLEAGPQIGFLVDSKLVVNVLGQSVSQDAKDLFKKIDFGFNLGARYDISNKFSAGVRHSIGMSNVTKSESGDDSKIKNNVFSLSLGYKF